MNSSQWEQPGSKPDLTPTQALLERALFTVNGFKRKNGTAPTVEELVAELGCGGRVWGLMLSVTARKYPETYAQLWRALGLAPPAPKEKKEKKPRGALSGGGASSDDPPAPEEAPAAHDVLAQVLAWLEMLPAPARMQVLKGVIAFTNAAPEADAS